MNMWMNKDFVTSIDIVRNNDYILTPGRYVEIEGKQEEKEPFKDKMNRLTAELSDMFNESHELEMKIVKRLGEIGFEIK